MSDDEMEIVFENILPSSVPREVQDSRATVVSPSDPGPSSGNGVPRISIEQAIKIKAQVSAHLKDRYQELENNSVDENVGSSNTLVNSSPFSCKTKEINGTKTQHSSGNSRLSKRKQIARKLNFSGVSPRTPKPTSSISYPSVRNKNPKTKSALSRRSLKDSSLTNRPTDESETMSSVIEMITLINDSEYCFKNLRFHGNTVLANFRNLFCEEEINIIHSFFRMTKECRNLYQKMYKSKYKWRRLSDYHFNEALLTNIKILLEQKFILMGLPNWNSATGSVSSRIDGLLEMLKASELRILCESLNINVTIHRRNRYIEEILQHIQLQTPVGGQRVVSAEDVWKSITNIVGHNCFIMLPEIYGLFQRIHFLFVLKCSASEQNVNATEVSETKYPEYIIDSTSNLFSSRNELLRFQRAADLWSEFSELIESKNWCKACRILCAVRKNFNVELKEEDDG